MDRAGLSCKKSGDTYSRAFGTTIGSESLTTVFGMGTGVTFQICSPESSRRRQVDARRLKKAGFCKSGRAVFFQVALGDQILSCDTPHQKLDRERWIYVAKRSSVSTG